MTKEKLEQTIQYLKSELSKIRAGRVSIDIFENIEVEAYGSKLPLSQLATISSPEPRVIVISPWDKNALKDIENAIRSQMGDINPIVDGEIIRVVFPAPTQERRNELVKEARKIAEEAKIRIRQIREDEMRNLKNKEDKKEISEDDLFKEKDDMQKLVGEYNKIIEDIENKKEEEITTI